MRGGLTGTAQSRFTLPNLVLLRRLDKRRNARSLFKRDDAVVCVNRHSRLIEQCSGRFGMPDDLQVTEGIAQPIDRGGFFGQ